MDAETKQGPGRDMEGPHRDHRGCVNIMQRVSQICQAPVAAGLGLEEEGKGVARWETEAPVTSFSRCCSYDSPRRGEG